MSEACIDCSGAFAAGDHGKDLAQISADNEDYRNELERTAPHVLECSNESLERVSMSHNDLVPYNNAGLAYKVSESALLRNGASARLIHSDWDLEERMSGRSSQNKQ